MRVSDPIDFVAERNRRLLRHHQENGYVRLGPIFEELGIKVVEKQLPNGVSGFAEYIEGESPSGFVVYINEKDDPRRKRFTAAHELAHCLLHPEFVKYRSVLDAIQRVEDEEFLPPEEVEANEFAGSLLLSEFTYDVLRRKSIWKYEDVARHQGISVAAAARRINEIRHRRKARRLHQNFAA